jgi:hypothetical protein
MKLFLDDVRTPPAFGWVVARTADEAIDYLKTHEVYFASLDHDLADEHYPWNAIPNLPNQDDWPEHMNRYPVQFKEKTGYDVILWMEENNVWPSHGVICHSMNPVGRQRINAVIEKHYGKLFD